MVPFIALHLDRRARAGLQRQLYDELRAAILGGRLAPGARLPATRVLADDLAVSRNTVTGAFDQLLAEGYLEGRVGSGTYVARTLPEDLLRVRSGARPAASPARVPPRLSRRGKLLVSIPASRRRDVVLPRAFETGLPALDEFPRELWARLASRLLRRAPASLLTYSDSAGFRPLRLAIAEYLQAARGVRCTADQVIVTAGSQQALDLAARVLLDPGDTAWVEDPGYLGSRGALTAAGIRCAPVPVDAEGLQVETGVRLVPAARMACVTPSHQYPLGVTMSLPRRMALLAWARQRRAWIVEDDYDSEFRYAGRPLAALQGLDPAGRVIYTGSFSKVLYPSIRLGYLVVPDGVVDAFLAARALADRQSPGLEQALVAEFIAAGHFSRHLRRMRGIYAERQQILTAAAQRDLQGALELTGGEAGMHMVGWLAAPASDRGVSERAAALGIKATPLSTYAIRARIRPGLMLGYAALPERQIREGVRALAAVLEKRSTT